MKIFFNKTLAVGFISMTLFSLFSCNKKTSLNTNMAASPLAGALVKNQTDTKSKDDQPLISFDKSKAIKDEGNKTFNEVTAMKLVRDMKTGWNLGNTLESTGGGNSLSAETSWGMPKTTKAMIDGLAASGLKTIRIPVSWSRHMDKNYTIDPLWMKRVKEVVDWAIEDDMYVVLNSHHDNYMRNAKMPARSGFYPTNENYEESRRFVCNVWAQIALAFNNGYDEHLVFETLNEPRLCGTPEEWWYNPDSLISQEAMANLNRLNQAILDTIRESGGNNKKRMVACPSLQASPESALAYTFKMPTDYDFSTKRLIVSVHMYTPYKFAMESPGIKEYSAEVENEFTSLFKQLNDKFILNGYAVYIGEYGAVNKDNLDDRVKWFHAFVKNSRSYGMPCFVWDNGQWQMKNGDASEKYGYYNRNTQTWFFPEIIQAINEEVNK